MPENQPRPVTLLLKSYLSEQEEMLVQITSQSLREATEALDAGNISDSKDKTLEAAKAQQMILSLGSISLLIDEKISEIEKDLSRRSIDLPKGSKIEVMITFPETQVDYKIPFERNVPIEDLSLSTRTYNALKRAGFTTVWDLLIQGDDLKNNVRNFGDVSERETKDKLKEFGFDFSDEQGKTDQ